MITAMAEFLLILMVPLFPIVSPARYELNSDWKVINNASLKSEPAGMGYGSFRQVVNSLGHPITSDNRTFGLAFLDLNNTGNFYLSVMLGVHTGQAVPIWTANRNSPVSDNAAVQILSGDMELVDAHNQRVWSPFKLVIRGMELTEDGNFRLFDDQDGTMWQTFDNPVDVLMPGQMFRTGSKLVASSEPSSMAEGLFVTSVEVSGLALYLRSPDAMVEPQAYSISTMQNTSVKRQLSTVLHECPSYHTVFSYSGANFLLEYEAKDNSTVSSGVLPCSVPRKVHFPFIDASLGLRFMRLEYNGDLVAYGFDSSSGSWKSDFSWESLVQDKVCRTPLFCGRYSVCQPQGSVPCKCLSSTSQQYDIDSSSACPSPSPTPAKTCSKATSLVELLGVSYFLNKLLPPDVVLPLEKCLDMCKTNCTCAAIFYSKNSSGCYFVKDILGSLDYDATAAVQYSAHLKLGNASVVLTSGNHSALRGPKLAGVTAAALLVVLVVTGAFLLGLRNRKRLKEEQLIMRSLFSAMPGAAPHRFSYKTLKLATRGFTQKLGSGGFGSVYAGTLSNGTRLAVKALEVGGGPGGQKQFVAEVVSLGSISHVNIVRLCGYCVHGTSRLLVYEHVANGSLDQWLFNHSERSLSWESRWRIALGTARGIAYLHEECREPIIHLDIKPQNILLDEEFTAKVSDFGMSKLLTSKDITQVVTVVRGTPGYLAPEWLLNSVATKKCDVYSYGMVLLELLSGRRNVDPTKLASSGNALSWYFPTWSVDEFKAGRLLKVVDEKIRCVEILPLVETLFKVALWCIQDNPSTRPLISKVVQMLDGTRDVPEPPLTFQSYFQQQQQSEQGTSSENASVAAPVSMSIEAR